MSTGANPTVTITVANVKSTKASGNVTIWIAGDICQMSLGVASGSSTTITTAVPFFFPAGTVYTAILYEVCYNIKGYAVTRDYVDCINDCATYEHNHVGEYSAKKYWGTASGYIIH